MDENLVSSFVTVILPNETHSCEWMKLPEGDYTKCVSTVACLHGVDLRHLFFYYLLPLAEFVFANYTLTDPCFQKHEF